jgi:hypothetical protein
MVALILIQASNYNFGLLRRSLKEIKLEKFGATE